MAYLHDRLESCIQLVLSISLALTNVHPAPYRTWGRAIFPLGHFFLDYEENLSSEHEMPKHKKTKILKPVSSTSRRGARAAYHDECPRDFGSRIAYTVS